MKRLALDENVPRASVRLLLAQGIDILDIHSSHRGLSDEAIVTICNKEQRILVTFDRDFGELIFRKRLYPEFGVIYLRLTHFTPTRPAEILLELLRSKRYPFEKSIVVVDDKFIRQRKFD